MSQTLARPAPRQRLPQAGAIAPGKFRNPQRCADGATRAAVDFRKLETLWFNTGTLCNIQCPNCYIESSPANDRLVYLARDEVAGFLDEIARDALGTRQIGLTGGEPFMNPDIIPILEDILARGFEALVLTNAMQPMMRPHMRKGLSELHRRFGAQLILRVSLDHYAQACHDLERGPGSWRKTLQGLRWISQQGIVLHVAGRTFWEEDEAELRAGFAELFARENLALDARDPEQLILFPEMAAGSDVAEITAECWDILKVDPASLMCATGRMVVKRKGAERPAVVACTLLPYDRRFEMGETLAQASARVALNHPHCARFCVLGGGSCAGKNRA